MIVRILGEGQYEIDDALLKRIEAHDADLNAAIEIGDEAAFEATLRAMITAVRASGRPVAATTIAPSELVLPSEGATIADVKHLLASEATGES